MALPPAYSLLARPTQNYSSVMLERWRKWTGCSGLVCHSHLLFVSGLGDLVSAIAVVWDVEKRGKPGDSLHSWRPERCTK